MTVITHQKDGIILATDEVQGKSGEQYGNVVEKGEINEGEQEVFLNTINEKGDIIATHQFKVKVPKYHTISYAPTVHHKRVNHSQIRSQSI